ncbi:MAG: ribosome biogenesis GTP-binding protein YihA/YsxC [Pseudomonadota bacterium]
MTRSGAPDSPEMRAVFSGSCRFVKSVAQIPQLPRDDRPEIAFAGRSNVGKSSLINALTGQKGLARTSNTPGRTQLLNYFILGEAAFLVDMPGYGYAKAPQGSVATWTKLIEDYLKSRENLRRVMLLIDARHGIKKNDEQAMAFLDSVAVSYQIVFTKLDKIKTEAHQPLFESAQMALQKRVASFPQVIATSAQTGEGMEHLREAVVRALD